MCKKAKPQKLTQAEIRRRKHLIYELGIPERFAKKQIKDTFVKPVTHKGVKKVGEFVKYKGNFYEVTKITSKGIYIGMYLFHGLKKTEMQ